MPEAFQGSLIYLDETHEESWNSVERHLFFMALFSEYKTIKGSLNFPAGRQPCILDFPSFRIL